MLRRRTALKILVVEISVQSQNRVAENFHYSSRQTTFLLENGTVIKERANRDV